MAISPNDPRYSDDPNVNNPENPVNGTGKYTYRSLLPTLQRQLNTVDGPLRDVLETYLNTRAPDEGARVNLTHQLMKKWGVSEAQASSFLRQYRNAIHSPNAMANERSAMAKPGEGLADRSAYGSEAEYEAALLAENGLGFIAEREAADAAAKAAEEDAARAAGVRGRLDAFAKEMMGDVSPDDPVLRQLLQAGTDAAQASAGQAGLSGRSGLAGTQAASLGQVNTLPYLQQRKVLGQQALTTLGNLDLGYTQLQSAENQYMQNRADLLAGEKWKAGMEAAQGPLGMFGTVAGGVIGAYAGGPQGAMAGAQIGGSGGRSLGAMNYAQAPTYSNYRQTPTWMSGSGGNKKPSGGGAGF